MGRYVVRLFSRLGGIECQSEFHYTDIATPGNDPATVDLENLADSFVGSTFLQHFRELHTDDVAFHELAVYGYSNGWAPSPFVEHRRPLALAGTIVTEASPPILAMIVSYLLEPMEPSPQTGKPVRRGYSPTIGVPEIWAPPTGALVVPSTEQYRVTNIEASADHDLSAPAIPNFYSHARFGAPGTLEPNIGLRGVSNIVGARVSLQVSTRRSRKLGSGT